MVCCFLRHYLDLLMSLSKSLQTLLEDLDDYVSRFFVADIMRELLFHGVDRRALWAPGTPQQTILAFPVAEHNDALWLRNIRHFFSDLDAGTAFSGR